jgi:hypothetical protein
MFVVLLQRSSSLISRLAFIILPGLAFIVASGCASRSALVIAERHASYSPSRTNTIALATHGKARAEDKELGRALVAGLTTAGFDIVPASQADYSLAYWIDDSWNPMVIPPTSQSGANPQPIPYPGPGGTVRFDSARAYPAPPYPVQNELLTKGIRLRLLSNRGTASQRLTPVWEGYVEIGPELSPERELHSLNLLLSHFGENFKGRVPLPK